MDQIINEIKSWCENFKLQNLIKSEDETIQPLIYFIQIICLISFLGNFATFHYSFMPLITFYSLIKIAVYQLIILGLRKNSQFAWILAFGSFFQYLFSYLFPVACVGFYLLSKTKFFKIEFR